MKYKCLSYAVIRHTLEQSNIPVIDLKCIFGDASVSTSIYFAILGRLRGVYFSERSLIDSFAEDCDTLLWDGLGPYTLAVFRITL